MEYTVKVDQEGTVRYYKPGTDLLHREDGPAVVWKYGAQEWYREGKRHREDGPAETMPNGYEAWYQDGKHHREDGPALVCSTGSKSWYQHGMLHREDGPAIECSDGRMRWYLDNKELSEAEFKERMDKAQVRTFKMPTDTKEIRIQLE